MQSIGNAKFYAMFFAGEKLSKKGGFIQPATLLSRIFIKVVYIKSRRLSSGGFS
jgi:hypothetical protein